jgi:diacylglycerol kinase (ATP)
MGRKSFWRSRSKSFCNAFEGCKHVIRTQRSAWIHAVISVMVLLLAFWLGLKPLEWAIILLVMGLVWAAEFFNTALEVVVDLTSQGEYHQLAKVAKDVAAGAVLITAICSVVIGLLVLGPLLWQHIF